MYFNKSAADFHCAVFHYRYSPGELKKYLHPTHAIFSPNNKNNEKMIQTYRQYNVIPLDCICYAKHTKGTKTEPEILKECT